MKGFTMVLAMVAALLFFIAAPAMAQQDDVLFDLMKCDRFTEQAERMACFNDMVNRYRGEISESRAATPPSTVVPTPQGWEQVESPTPPAAESSASAADVATGVNEEDIRRLDDESLRERVDSYYAARRVTEIPPHQPTVDDLPLPFETRVTAFVKNDRTGDFKLRIKEGWVFERSGGPDPRALNLKGKTAVLQKNTLGHWRLKLEGEALLLAVRPVGR